MAPVGVTAPTRIESPSCSSDGQTRSRIETVISRLMPLPMPRSVICSPSHMMKMAPMVSVETMMARVKKPGFGTAPGIPSTNSVKV